MPYLYTGGMIGPSRGITSQHDDVGRRQVKVLRRHINDAGLRCLRGDLSSGRKRSCTLVRSLRLFLWAMRRPAFEELLTAAKGRVVGLNRTFDREMQISGP